MLKSIFIWQEITKKCLREIPVYVVTAESLDNTGKSAKGRRFRGVELL